MKATTATTPTTIGTRVSSFDVYSASDCLVGSFGKVSALSPTPSPTESGCSARARWGIDISKHRSKSIEEFRGKDVNLVVKVCESSVGVICPFCSSSIVGGQPEIIDETLIGANHYLHRPFSDPSEVAGNNEERIESFCRIRDDISK